MGQRKQNFGWLYVVVNVINRRVSSIKVIINWWNKGQVNSAINALNMQNDLGLTMDVINFTLA